MALLLAKTAAAGISPAAPAVEEPDTGVIYLWPECVAAWEAFLDLGDQWRDGVLPRADVVAHLREQFPDDEERREVYECVCACARVVRRVHAEHEAGRRRREADARRREANAPR